ncbi:hypothetical protein BN126390071 [Stenotrophomonas indicatrix]|nr:hypothetical protein BN126390071 [Stenotrophomonas indicatrix]
MAVPAASSRKSLLLFMFCENARCVATQTDIRPLHGINQRDYYRVIGSVLDLSIPSTPTLASFARPERESSS